MAQLRRRLWTAPYLLRARSAIGARARTSERSGVLIRVETADSVGFACVQPWEELGDADLPAELQALRDGRPLALGHRALALADLDAEFRKGKKNALTDLPELPGNHYLFGSIGDLTGAELRRIWDLGFRHLKIKLGRNWNVAVEQLFAQADDLSLFRLRFDFNGMLTPPEFLAFLGALPENLRQRIDFVEDPVGETSESEWIELLKRSSVPLAVDRCAQSRGDWLVLKPAAQDPNAVLSRFCGVEGAYGEKKTQICVTSYLDHPVGQMGAALEGALLLQRLAPVTAAGLASHFSYENNEFSECLLMKGSRLLPAPGFGVGFDDLLERQEWKALV